MAGKPNSRLTRIRHHNDNAMATLSAANNAAAQTTGR